MRELAGGVVVAVGSPSGEATFTLTEEESDDIRTAAREAHGLERLDQVKWAVLDFQADTALDMLGFPRDHA